MAREKGHYTKKPTKEVVRVQLKKKVRYIMLNEIKRKDEELRKHKKGLSGTIEI